MPVVKVHDAADGQISVAGGGDVGVDQTASNIAFSFSVAERVDV